MKKGHRQELHVLRIADIVLNGKSAAAVRKAENEAKTERQRLEEAARRQAAEDAALAEEARRPRQVCGASRKVARKPKAGQGRRLAKATTAVHGEGRHAKTGKTATPIRTERRQASRREEAARHEEGRVDPMAHKKAGSSSKNGHEGRPAIAKADLASS